MEKEPSNYFIIERLDISEESDVLSNIYDLSILNKAKEIKNKNSNKIKKIFRNIIKNDETKKINQTKKALILQVVKKAILSSNLTYKWKLIKFKNILICFHIFFFISTISHFINDKNGNSIFNILLNDTNIDNNITNKYNNSTNLKNLIDKTLYIANNINKKSNNKSKIYNSFLLSLFIKQIFLIPIWIVFRYKYIPKWDRINDILYKFTSYLLFCESHENNYYFYYLMKDFSILVTTKQYYYKNKELLAIPTRKIEYISEKNIILYSINIISDMILEKPISLNYYELIPSDDYTDIKILTKYIEKNLNEKIKIFNRKILSPILIGLIIAILYNNPSLEYFIYSFTFLSLIFFISAHIFKEYIKVHKLNIDNFIDILNQILIKKNRFIYRKNKLIMYLALKENNYTKNQIIKFIEKIINS